MEKQKLLWLERDPALDGRNYIGMFDLTKGLIMVQIIVTHCIYDYFNILDYSGGSPLFQILLSPLTLLRYGPVPMLFMICGYGIRRQPVGKHVKNTLKLFLFPYLCVIITVTAGVFITWCLTGGSLGAHLQRQVLPFFLGFHPGSVSTRGSMAQIGPVWFFFTYIFSSIFLNLVLQEKRVWLQILYLTAASVLGMILVGLPLPFCIQQILICSGFMYVGIQLKNFKIPQQKLPLPALLTVYALCAFTTKLGGLAEIGNNLYRFGAIDLLIGYLAGVVLLWLHLRLNVLQGVIADGLRWIGRHMMWLCCVHTVSYLLRPWKQLAVYFADRPAVGLLLESVLSLAFALGGCALVDAASRGFRAAKRRKSAIR